MQPHGISTIDLRNVLDATRPLWTEFRHQRLFITGGTGFFGCWLLESFLAIQKELALKATVTVLTRNPDAFSRRVPHLAKNPAVTLIAGDVKSFRFPAGEFAYVIHAATDVAVAGPEVDPLIRLSSIRRGTARTLEFAATHGTRKFLLTSSGSVYGPQPEHLSHIPEDYWAERLPLNPASAYAEGKRLSEMMCAEYAERTSLEIKIARCFAFAGPYLPLNANFALGNFVRDVINGKDILVQSDGTATRSYLYAGDLAIWLWTIFSRAPSMQPFNVGSEDEVSIAELAHQVIATLNPTLRVHFLKQSDPLVPRMRYVPSTLKARNLLGLRQGIDLKEIIRRTAEWNGFANVLGASSNNDIVG